MLSAMDTKDAGRMGGLARAKNLNQEERIEIGKNAARSRWRRNNKQSSRNDIHGKGKEQGLAHNEEGMA